MLTMSKVARAKFNSGLFAHGRDRLEAAGYLIAGLIGLGAGPALFVAVDHTVVVRWSNQILDFVSRQ